MERQDEINKIYDVSKKIEIFLLIIFWVNILLSFLTIVFVDVGVLKILYGIQITLSVVYVVTNVIDDNLLWYYAEKIRRQSSIENAFDVDLIEYKTEGFYNNDIKNSIDKYTINIFESILHSKTTLKLMLPGEVLKTVTVCIAFLVSCLVYKEYNLLLVISQLVFSSYFLQGFIKFFILKVQLDKLYRNFYRQLISTGVKSKQERVILLSYAIEYEAIKAHYKVRLSQKLFLNHNLETSEKWNELKSKIKLSGKDCY